MKTEWKVGDKVEIREYSCIQSVDTVKEITKGGNLRLTNENRLFNPDGNLRGGGAWSSLYMRKITEQEYENYFIIQKLKQQKREIIQLLQQILEKDLIANWAKLDRIYDILN